jgi:transposase
VKGLRFPLLKNPEDLTEGQASALGALKRAGTALWRGYLLKEGLRAVFRAAPGAGLDGWLAWACRSRIPQFVELSRKVRRKRGGILKAIELGASMRPRRGRQQQDQGRDKAGLAASGTSATS